MHIPDGYMSLQTTIPLLGAMAPVWSAAVRKVRKFAGSRNIPLLALCAAFSFVIMMFNIPVGPSSVHAVGAVFIAILLGPWAACVAVSVALVIQAVVFGDGGLLAIGVNTFNMAFALPFTGYYIHRVISGKADVLSRRSLAGIFAGSYIGMNVTSLLVAFDFGIQPLLFKTAGGVPEYGFYPLSVSIPAMMTESLLVTGPIEALITIFAVIYLSRFAPHMLDRARSLAAEPGKSFFYRFRAFIIGLAVLVAFVPAGLLASGSAWGEWGKEEIRNMLGYVPAGLDKLSGFWKAVFPKYSIESLGGGFFGSSLGYVLSALIGILLIFGVLLVSSKLMVNKNDTKK